MREMRSGYVEHDGLLMYYQVHGDPVPTARPLLLIHGGGNTIESNWQHLIPFMTRGRQVIAIEEEGHGRTQPIDRELTSDASADDVAAVLAALWVGVADVLAFSAGASTALALAMRHPSLVGRLILASSFFRRDGMVDGFWEGLSRGTLADMPQALKDADLALNDQAHLQRLFELDSRRMLTSVDIPDASLAAITAPTLVVVGDRDVVRVSHAVRMAELLPDARLLVLPAIHGDYLGEVDASADGGTALLERTVPFLLAFLDEDD